MSDIKDKSLKKSVLLYMFMNMLTFGIWSRFRPRKGGWSGSWGPYALFITLMCTFLIGERFFKEEINEHLKNNTSAQIQLPDSWAFENQSVKISKDEFLQLKDQVKKKNKEIIELKESNSIINNSLSTTIKKLENKKEEKSRIDTLKKELTLKNATIQFLEYELSEASSKLNARPMITTKSFEDIDKEIGCSSKFSDEKKKDLFKKDYKNVWAQWDGIIEHVNNEKVTISINEEVKLSAILQKPGSGYDLLKGESVSSSFMLINKGDCNIEYVGDKAEIYKN